LKKIRLGVNIDHVATLRQVRGDTTSYPDMYQAAKLAVKGGAKQLTIHLREDRRHIQDKDVVLLCKKRPALINLEMAATSEMEKIALKHKPDWVCIVPEKRQELTTEGGLDVVKMAKTLKPMIQKLSKNKIKVSLFIEANAAQIKMSAKLGADAIEIHTGKWVTLKGDAEKTEWKKMATGAALAHKLGMRVHAGHGLDFKTTKKICKLPYIQELNIGHSLICYAIEMGLEKAVRKMAKIMKAAR
jgi:pyridoxine 5-phosphate synthase